MSKPCLKPISKASYINIGGFLKWGYPRSSSSFMGFSNIVHLFLGTSLYSNLHLFNPLEIRLWFFGSFFLLFHLFSMGFIHHPLPDFQMFHFGHGNPPWAKPRTAATASLLRASEVPGCRALSAQWSGSVLPLRALEREAGRGWRLG